MSSPGAGTTSSDELGRKARKPYTMTKSRESWTKTEDDKFVEALHLFDRDWKKIEAFVGSKSVIQIRSHAQKYFLKVQKNGTNEHVPPPRPKRKATHPYPQKDAKKAPHMRQTKSLLQAQTSQPKTKSLLQDSCLFEPGYASTTETSSMLGDPNAMTVSSTDQGSAQPVTAPLETTVQANLVTSLDVMPDFAEVYRFLGSLFDPGTSGHMQKLKAMNPINVETVLLLMRNLFFNLTSPQFQAHTRLFEASSHNTADMFPARDAINTPVWFQGEQMLFVLVSGCLLATVNKNLRHFRCHEAKFFFTRSFCLSFPVLVSFLESDRE